MSDSARFEALYRDTRADVLAYLIRRAGDREEAAELLAETYLVAWRRFDTVPTGPEARLWLFGVARNLLLKAGRRRHVHTALVARLAHELRVVDTPVHGAENDRADAVAAALATLSARDRELITLTAWEGLSPGEIAAVTGSSANVVRVRLHRARARLVRELPQRSCPSAPAATSA